MNLSNTTAAFARLVEIVAELREKCPWDRAQTIESLRHLTLEETYELADAILKNDLQELKTEVGDLLLHVVFYAIMGEEKAAFDLQNVIETLIDKLIRRHPHIYGDMHLDNADDVLKNWEKIKTKEKEGKKKSVLAGVPESMPSLLKAFRMQEKAAGIGFDWKESAGAWLKVKEEILEFEQADNQKDKVAEMGDLFFALINYCRLEGINPDEALARTNHKFKTRFEFMENAAEAQQKSLSDMELEEMEEFWQMAKTEEKK
ncbi:MAG: nucleoside triphosphate pyrophosphohydrolase [Bacteroidia bacterium]